MPIGRSKLNPNAAPYIPMSSKLRSRVCMIMVETFEDGDLYVPGGTWNDLEKPQINKDIALLEKLARNLDHNTPPSRRPEGFENRQIGRLNIQTGLRWSWNPFDSFHVEK